MDGCVCREVCGVLLNPRGGGIAVCAQVEHEVAFDSATCWRSQASGRSGWRPLSERVNHCCVCVCVCVVINRQ